MKKLFYIGLSGIVLFEILNIYFIMPGPGSQRINSIDLAYFLYDSRWVFRTIFIVLAVAGSLSAFRTRRKWLPFAGLLLTVAITYLLNFKFIADKMFLKPENVILKSQAENKVPGHMVVLGVAHNGEAKAYPIEFLRYHHQVPDSIGGKAMLVTYCDVCRTGRVFDPVVNGKYENFRLVGMDHFNALLEDETTKSWWRQANGLAIAGELEGTTLAEIDARQMTIDKWFALYPEGKVMQPDEVFIEVYDSLAKYEKGKHEDWLVRSDSLSWKERSWIVGIVNGNSSKAYDWNHLEKVRIINDKVGRMPVVLALSSDGQSFAAFERSADQVFTINEDDTFVADSITYDFSGKDMSSALEALKPVKAYQEFWLSWSTFHPDTKRYDAEETANN